MRFKTFVATGIAPDGRLYAGDLNGLQDLYLPLSDFTSTVDVGTLRVGDATLQILKYGAGEFRMSGDLRIDGIFRALGGMLSGQFTTTQRDAIAVGRRPFGLIIFNTTTNRYEYNAGTDSTPNWQPLSGVTAHASTHLPGGSDPLNFATGVNLSGTRAAKPSASAANNGLFYFETDWQALWRSNGSSWVRVAHYPRHCTISQFGSLPDFQDGDEVILEASAAQRVKWHMRYNSGSASAYKWEFLGGAPIYSKDDTLIVVTSTSYVLNTPTITIPRAGEYDVDFGSLVVADTFYPYVSLSAYVTPFGPGLSASDSNAAEVVTVTQDRAGWNTSRNARVTFTSAGAVQLAYRATTTQEVEFSRREISITPVSIG